MLALSFAALGLAPQLAPVSRGVQRASSPMATTETSDWSGAAVWSKAFAEVCTHRYKCLGRTDGFPHPLPVTHPTHASARHAFVRRSRRPSSMSTR